MNEPIRVPGIFWDFPGRRILFHSRPKSIRKSGSGGLPKILPGTIVARVDKNVGWLEKFPLNLCFDCRVYAEI